MSLLIFTGKSQETLNAAVLCNWCSVQILRNRKKMKSKWGCHLCVCITRRLTIKYLLPLFSPKDKSFEKEYFIIFFTISIIMSSMMLQFSQIKVSNSLHKFSQVNHFQKIPFIYHFFREFEQKIYKKST